MKKSIFVFLGCILFFLFIHTQHVFAGGCCYKYFTSVDGIAGKQDAVISVAFVDPRNPYASPLPSLQNQRIDVHIKDAKPGQFCRTTSEKTDAEGRIGASCGSPFPGDVYVFFTAPDLNEQANSAIKGVPKTIFFLANPNLPRTTSTPTPTVARREPSPIKTLSPTQIITPPTEVLINKDETEALQQRLNTLEAQVASQQKQVNTLQGILTNIMNFFEQLFRK